MGPKPSLRDEVVDRIRLHRGVDAGAIIICEGSPDRIVLRSVLPRPPQIFPAGPRHVALAVTSLVKEHGLGPVLAVVDRDFDDEVAVAQGLGLPVVAFDGADLESALWASPILEIALEALGNQSKIESVGGAAAVRLLIDELIEPLERLRVANSREGWGLDFDSLDLRRRIKPGSMSLSVPGLCDSLLRGSGAADRRALLDAATEEHMLECPRSGALLVRGKDRIAALGVALKRRLGALSHQESHVDNVARVFYASARHELLRSQGWLADVEAWTEQHR